MAWESTHVSVIPGDAVVARRGAAILVSDPSSAAHEEFLDAVLAVCDAPVGDGVDDTGVVRAVAALVAARPADDVPPFGMLASTSRGIAALLCGRATATGKSSEGDELTIRGTDAITFVDRLLGADPAELTLALGDEPGSADPRSDLTAGIVRGAGVHLRPRVAVGPTPTEPEPTELATGPAVDDAPAAIDTPVEPEPEHYVEPEPEPEPEPPSAVQEADTPAAAAPAPLSEDELVETSAMPPVDEDDDAPGFEAIDLFGPSDDGETAPDEGDPADETPVESPRAGAKIVQGIVCSRGHFNRPDGKFCARCGISMVHQTHNIVSGERPPLGVLVIDDGSVFALTDDLVIGREPSASAEVARGAAQPLLLDDTALTLSRVHARVLLDGWEVRIEDAGSANGTYVMGPRDDAWTRLEPELPTTIEPGARLSVGGRTLTFESHQRD